MLILTTFFVGQRCKPDVSKSVVTAIRFTVGDHIIIKCSWINKKYEANHYFSEDVSWQRIEFSGLKHLTEKVTAVASLTRVRVVVDHTMPIPLQRSTKLKISHWYFDQWLYRIKISSCVKNILSKRFLRNFFTHIHLRRCLSSMMIFRWAMAILRFSIWRPPPSWIFEI